MIETIFNLFTNFVLHIQINTINIAYTHRLPRPYRSNLVSRYFRRLLETKWIRPLIGAQLALASVAVPAFTPDAFSSVIYEPPLQISQQDLLITDSFIPPIHTQTTHYTLPVVTLRYVGQEFHSGHHALDLNSYVGDPVLAFAPGRVHKIEDGAFGYGRYILLDHGHGLTSLYAHLKTFNVSLGQVVDSGEKIGEIGMTGYTTGPHLHFEIHDNGVALNPRSYFDL